MADLATEVHLVQQVGNMTMNPDRLKFMSLPRTTQLVMTPALVLLLCRPLLPRLQARRNAARLKRWGHTRQTVLTLSVRTGIWRNIKSLELELQVLNID